MSRLSNCCGANPVGDIHNNEALCAKCKEHAYFTLDDDTYIRELEICLAQFMIISGIHGLNLPIRAEQWARYKLSIEQRTTKQVLELILRQES